MDNLIISNEHNGVLLIRINRLNKKTFSNDLNVFIKCNESGDLAAKAQAVLSHGGK